MRRTFDPERMILRAFPDPPAWQATTREQAAYETQEAVPVLVTLEPAPLSPWEVVGLVLLWVALGGLAGWCVREMIR